MSERTITFMPHYKVQQLESLDHLKEIFKNGADELNWLVASTSGIHGGYTKLDDIEQTWELDPEDEKSNGKHITLLVIQPRLCVLKYGEIQIHDKEDIKWLRGIISQSIEMIKKSQKGNL